MTWVPCTIPAFSAAELPEEMAVIAATPAVDPAFWTGNNTPLP
ncbi:Unknown protein sequence [Pseudomonas syringae pv. aceris]|nr:Unknown protein sequence [Pseudomonas syringae pv. aceris]